jgi:formylglycine-generating enzyme required for sulfatase activity
MAVRRGLSALLAVCLLAGGGEAMAGTDADWLQTREAEHRAWLKERGEPDIDAIKARTEKLVAASLASRARELADREAQWLAASRAMPDAQRTLIEQTITRANDLVEDGLCADAEHLYRQVLDQEPLNAEARFALGQCLLKLGRQSEAARMFTDVIEMPLARDNWRMTKTFSMLAIQSLPPPPAHDLNDPSLVFEIAYAPAEVWDAPFAPVMAVVPAGEFTMGSPEGEQFRLPNEKQHRVRIHYPLAMTKYNVTRGEFAHFVAETGYEAKGCNLEGVGGMKWEPDGDWRTPGFEQTDDHPVACINFHDATAYAEWLSGRTGQRYRLPSEAEWEHAMRGGTSTAYYWGPIWEPGRANVDGQPGQPGGRATTPGGTFPPNPFGLYDMAGNVWVWLADCYNASYDGAPSDGSAWMSGNCAMRMRRSGSWFNIEKAIEGDFRQPGRLRSASRFASIPSLRYSSFGFRLVREL